METKLEDWQIPFIDKMKAKGLAGCIITINNNQVYLSFQEPPAAGLQTTDGVYIGTAVATNLKTGLNDGVIIGHGEPVAFRTPPVPPTRMQKFKNWLQRN